MMMMSIGTITTTITTTITFTTIFHHSSYGDDDHDEDDEDNFENEADDDDHDDNDNDDNNHDDDAGTKIDAFKSLYTVCAYYRPRSLSSQFINFLACFLYDFGLRQVVVIFVVVRVPIYGACSALCGEDFGLRR